MWWGQGSQCMHYLHFFKCFKGIYNILSTMEWKTWCYSKAMLLSGTFKRLLRVSQSSPHSVLLILLSLTSCVCPDALSDMKPNCRLAKNANKLSLKRNNSWHQLHNLYHINQFYAALRSAPLHRKLQILSTLNHITKHLIGIQLRTLKLQTQQEHGGTCLSPCSTVNGTTLSAWDWLI